MPHNVSGLSDDAPNGTNCPDDATVARWENWLSLPISSKRTTRRLRKDTPTWVANCLVRARHRRAAFFVVDLMTWLQRSISLLAIRPHLKLLKFVQLGEFRLRRIGSGGIDLSKQHLIETRLEKTVLSPRHSVLKNLLSPEVVARSRRIERGLLVP